jgi:hypothetical protein
MSYIVAAYYIGSMTNMVITFANSNVARINATAQRFVKRHKLDYETAFRVNQVISTNQQGGYAEVLYEENLFLESLPVRMQVDILFQVRLGVTQRLQFFQDMLVRTPRVLRTVVHKMKMVVGVEGESMFALGDICTQFLFIQEGTFLYKCDELRLVATPRRAARPRHVRSQFGADYLEKGDVVSEAVLWTTWEQQGSLVCNAEALLLSFDAESFVKEILAHKRATNHAVRYARHFCWRLNRTEAVTDLMGWDLSLNTLDSELYVGGLEDHFAFISHYKMEGGSEATLMRDEMERLIRKDTRNPMGDLRTPIFVDSEDLVDLSRLSEHVKGSLALIVLLTPGFLSRPYCLLEIVIASRWERPYVPVQIMRPGISQEFRIPDEEFYSSFRRGEIIGTRGVQLLEENGVTPAEVENAIRCVFKMIALPFSPHKSAAVRRAEMDDILKRCMTVTGDGW